MTYHLNEVSELSDANRACADCEGCSQTLMEKLPSVASAMFVWMYAWRHGVFHAVPVPPFGRLVETNEGVHDELPDMALPRDPMTPEIASL